MQNAIVMQNAVVARISAKKKDHLKIVALHVFDVKMKIIFYQVIILQMKWLQNGIFYNLLK